MSEWIFKPVCKRLYLWCKKSRLLAFTHWYLMCQLAFLCQITQRDGKQAEKLNVRGYIAPQIPVGSTLIVLMMMSQRVASERRCCCSYRCFGRSSHSSGSSKTQTSASWQAEFSSGSVTWQGKVSILTHIPLWMLIFKQKESVSVQSNDHVFLR